jgi:tRNA (cytidine/uridine-2'-O-)-methyltransferase
VEQVKVGSSGVQVVLVEPEIPPNTGNVARLCAALEIPLHLVGKLGFELSDRYLKRAGLDYWEHVDLHIHADPAVFFKPLAADRVYLFTKKSTRLYTEAVFRPGDYLVFGSETKGLPEEILRAYPDRLLRLPMLSPYVRSINLSSAVAVAVYEAVRQINQGRPG